MFEPSAEPVNSPVCVIAQPLPHRPYHSLVVQPRQPAEPKIRTAQVPVVSVERRPLSHYAELVGSVR